jgi:hypothetical protein
MSVELKQGTPNHWIITVKQQDGFFKYASKYSLVSLLVLGV